MSFDLFVYPPSGPATVAEVRQLMEAEQRRRQSRTDNPLPPPGPEMATFLDELEHRWPSLEDDPDGSPWSCWPLWGPMTGGGTGLNIAWSRADSMRPTILEIASRANVIVYDPQVDQVILPQGGTASRLRVHCDRPRADRCPCRPGGPGGGLKSARSRR